MDKKLKWLVIVMGIIMVLLILAIFFIPAKDKSQSQDDNKLNIVVTFSPLYDFTYNIIHCLVCSLSEPLEKVEIEVLFPETPEVSSFKPSDVQKINKADVLIINGAGLEIIIDELVRASDNKNLKIIDTSKGIKLSGRDPHIWLNPQNAIKQVENIRDGLIEIRPENSNYYSSASGYYIRELQNLDQKISNTVNKFKTKDIIVFHDAFGYFSTKYGLNQVAVFEETPGKEPSPADIANIIQIAKDKNIKALFAEPQFSPRLLEQIAKDLNIQTKTLDPIESKDTNSVKFLNYISRMENNLKELSSVLE